MGAAHNQAHISRGANTSKGEVKASTPQTLPPKDSAAQTTAGTLAQAWLIVKNRVGSHQCSHRGAAKAKATSGSHQRALMDPAAGCAAADRQPSPGKRKT
jgi:hypothetical protein